MKTEETYYNAQKRTEVQENAHKLQRKQDQKKKNRIVEIECA